MQLVSKKIKHKCVKCFTCGKRWSSWVLTEPGRHHPHLVLHPDRYCKIHEILDICTYTPKSPHWEYSRHPLLVRSHPRVYWTYLQVHREAGSGRCPPGWRWWTLHCRDSGRWLSRPPGPQCLCAYPGPPRFAVTGHPNAWWRNENTRNSFKKANNNKVINYKNKEKRPQTFSNRPVV